MVTSPEDSLSLVLNLSVVPDSVGVSENKKTQTDKTDH